MGEATTGYCTGGPLDGRQVAIRRGAGFLAVDRAAGKSWVYTRSGDGFAVCTDHDDSLLYPQGTQTGERRFDHDRAWQAGVDSSIDIIAV